MKATIDEMRVCADFLEEHRMPPEVVAMLRRKADLAQMLRDDLAFRAYARRQRKLAKRKVSP